MAVMGSFISLHGTVFGSHHTVYHFSILERAFLHSSFIVVRKEIQVEIHFKLQGNSIDLVDDVNFLNTNTKVCTNGQPIPNVLNYISSI